jgi:NifU-like protein involved in Fe-S cluster formation
MSDPLYRKELLRLAADAAGAGHLAHADGTATAHNPACGDRVTMEVQVERGRITDLAHQTEACVLTQASAAILGAHAGGLNSAELKALADHVAAMLNGGDTPPVPYSDYGVFDGVAGHKGRHVCVLLPLKAALEALEASEAATDAQPPRPL